MDLRHSHVGSPHLKQQQLFVNFLLKKISSRQSSENHNSKGRRTQTLFDTKQEMASQLSDGLDSHSDALYSALVGPAPDAEVAVFAPASSPAVLHNPILLACLLAPPIAHQQHRVIGQLKRVDRVTQARVMVDALFVVKKVRVDLKGHTHWAVPHQLNHHGRLVARAIEAAYVVVFRGVVANTVGRDGARRIFANVREALLLNDAEVLHIFTNQVWETAIAT